MTYSSPSGVDALSDQAYRAFGRADFGTARAVADAALELDPFREDLWRLLAEAHRETGCPSAAIGCLERLLDIAPEDREARLALGHILLSEGREEAAEAAFSLAGPAVARDPHLSYAHGLSLARTGRAAEADAAFVAALAALPDFAHAHFELATLRLAQEDYAGAWAHFERRHDLDPTFLPVEGVPQWTGQSLEGRRLLVTPEGGHGDMIWAARFLPAVAALGAEIDLQVTPALALLFSELNGVSAQIGLGAPVKPYDYWCPMLSVPGGLGLSDPDMHPPARLHRATDSSNRQEAIGRRSRGKRRVGIIWSGSESYGNNRHRAARLADFLPLVELPDVQLFSLQKGPPQAQCAEMGLGNLMVETDDYDFAETAAVVDALDLIVMTDSAVAHLAGSLGKPVWVLLDTGPYWYHAGGGQTSRWYPSMRYFRQTRHGDWSTVMDEVRHALEGEPIDGSRAPP